MTFAMMMPMLIMMFLFSGCMAVAPESIAGEKKRGTIATILVTPLKRSELALGKIFSAFDHCFAQRSVIDCRCAAFAAKAHGGHEVDAGVYGITEYGLLGIIVLSSVLLLIALISIISAYAKSIKEAQTLIMPLMIVVLMVGVSAMFGTMQENSFLYLIPIYGSVQSMGSIFLFQVNTVNLLITVISNFIYTALLIVVLTKMFNSERIIFTK